MSCPCVCPCAWYSRLFHLFPSCSSFSRIFCVSEQSFSFLFFFLLFFPKLFNSEENVESDVCALWSLPLQFCPLSSLVPFISVLLASTNREFWKCWKYPFSWAVSYTWIPGSSKWFHIWIRSINTAQRKNLKFVHRLVHLIGYNLRPSTKYLSY